MKKSGKRKAFTTILTTVALVVSMTACSSASPDENNTASKAETVSIEKQKIINSINVSGNVKGGTVVKITSTVNSKIKQLNVGMGDYVKEGDVLCVFDSSSLQDEYDSLKKNIEKSDDMNQTSHEINQRNLENAQAEKNATLNQAQRNIDEAINARDKAYEKYDSLFRKYNEYYNKKENLYSQFQESGDEMTYQDYQQALQIFQSTESELNILEEQLGTYDNAVQTAQDAYDNAERSANTAIQSIQDTINAERYEVDTDSRSRLEKLEEKIEECTVKAPRDGIITSLNIAEGSIPTTDAIMTIEDNKSLKIDVQIKEADILNIKEGMKAIIKTTASSDEEFYGKVSKVVNIFNDADPINQKEGGYTAEITVDKGSENLLIGMNAKVQIIIEEKDDVFAVPYDSIVETDDGKNVVYIARSQSDGSYKSEEVNIEKGMESDYYTEIISSDIKEGDLLVVSQKDMHNGKNIAVEDKKHE